MENIVNFRDLGGLQTPHGKKIKSGLLYRTGALQFSNKTDLTNLINKYNFKYYIDFKLTKETEGVAQVEHHELENLVQWIHLPINTHNPEFEALTKPNASDWTKLYSLLFHQNISTWVQFLKHLACAQAPVAYGCLVGKDRTGIASALLLGLLEITLEEVLEDYHLTSHQIKNHIHHFEKIWIDPNRNLDDFYNNYFYSDKQVIHNFLIENFNSPENIKNKLLENGLTEGDITLLKQKYLD